MNYRHAFHAGNFADLIKHAVLTHLLRDLTARPAPLTVIDTHAGAGLYDLGARPARRTGEAVMGIARLMADKSAPGPFNDLKAAVRRANGPGETRYYPGSPLLIAAALRAKDRLIACELRPDDHGALKQVLPRELGAVTLNVDGWGHAAGAAPPSPASLLVLIDPPFEQGDDHEQAARLVGLILKRNPGAVVAIWAPLKDLATYDAFLGEVEDAAAPRAALAVEVRLRPLHDPLKLNGCATVVVNPSVGLEAAAGAAARWIADHLGEAGASARSVLMPPAA